MPILSFAQTLTCGVTGSTLASGIEFPGGARNVTVFIPSAPSGADVRFYVSHNDSSYKTLKYAPTSGTVVVGSVQIGSAITNCAVKVNELAGQKFVKAELTSALTSHDATFVYVVEY